MSSPVGNVLEGLANIGNRVAGWWHGGNGQPVAGGNGNAVPAAIPGDPFDQNNLVEEPLKELQGAVRADLPNIQAEASLAEHICSVPHIISCVSQKAEREAHFAKQLKTRIDVLNNLFDAIDRNTNTQDMSCNLSLDGAVHDYLRQARAFGIPVRENLGQLTPQQRESVIRVINRKKELFKGRIDEHTEAVRQCHETYTSCLKIFTDIWNTHKQIIKTLCDQMARAGSRA